MILFVCICFIGLYKICSRVNTSESTVFCNHVYVFRPVMSLTKIIFYISYITNLFHSLSFINHTNCNLRVTRPANSAIIARQASSWRILVTCIKTRISVLQLQKNKFLILSSYMLIYKYYQIRNFHYIASFMLLLNFIYSAMLF